MGFKKVDFMDIYEIIRRWHNGQKIAHIAKNCQYDRKTVKKYVLLANELRISKDEPLPSKEQLLNLFKPFLSAKNQKSTPAQSILHTYQDELVQLINDPDYPLKPKIAFEVLCERHDLEDKISYTSFKRFVRNQQVFIKPDSSTCRIEVPPGSEIQIDYGYMGLLYDPLVGRKRRVYAFVATLSHSRHMYVEFVYKQTQQGFVASHVRMFENFGGIPIRLVIDNLKAGVIKPDLYDPVLNRAYREMAEYYNTFIDPCRVGRPQDKGKVENQVPVVRQQFRKQMALNPHLDIGSASQMVKAWCLGKQGHRIHGTTQWQPYPVFLKVEKSALKPLPEEPFEVPIWKQATVHSDHYIQFDKKAYSAPHALIGKKVWVKGTEKLVQIFYENTLMAQHLVTGHYRHTQDDHFPENVQAALGQGVPKFLQQKAARTSEAFGQMIRKVLQPHAFINLRKAQGLVALADKFDPDLIDQAATMVLKHDVHVTYKSFKIILEKLQDQKQSEQQIPLSKQTQHFIRAMDYFVQNS